jgi:hypothetical protein
MAGLKVKGVDELKRILKQLGDKAPKEAAKALYVEAQNIMSKSKDKYVPVDTSTLKNSGFVKLPEITGNKVSITLGYGGAASEYALAVHEHLSEHSPQSWIIAESEGDGVNFNVGGPKYLEIPLMNAKRGMAKRLARRIQDANRIHLRGGVKRRKGLS